MLAIGTAGIGVANSCFWNVKLKANRLICLINIPLESMQQWEGVVSVTMLRSGARGRKTHYCTKAVWGSWQKTRVLRLGWGRTNTCFSQEMADICFSSAGGPKSDHLKCCAPQLRAARAATMFSVSTAVCPVFSCSCKSKLAHLSWACDTDIFSECTCCGGLLKFNIL